VAAGVTSALFQRFKLPLVAGYLIAGVLIGPRLPFSLIEDQEVIHLLSELGVVLLMFSLGLELRIRQLARAVSSAGFSMAVEVGLMLALGYAAGQAMGWSPLASLFTGAMVSISSTSIVSQIFREQRITGSLREGVLGVLVFEDFAVILFIALLTAASKGQELSGADLAWVITRLIAVLLAFLVLGMFLVPRAVRLVGELKRDETMVVVGAGLCFGFAWLAAVAGFSVALGAFLAGVLAAESGLARIIERQVQPLRDMFAAIFFVAVGMQFDPAAVMGSWGVVLGFVLLVLVGKTVGVALGRFLAGRGVREAVQSGLSLAQIGEFSFVIAAVGVGSGAAPPLLAAIAISVSVTTAFLSPFLIQRSGQLAAWIDSRLPHPVQTAACLYGAWVEALRTTRSDRSKWRWLRQAAGWLVVDASIVVLLVVIGATADDWIASAIRSAGWAGTIAPWLVGTTVAALAAPFLFGIVRIARQVGIGLARMAIPEPLHGPDNGRAPRRTLAMALQIGVVLAVGVPLVVVTQPFVPDWSGVALLSGLVILLGMAFYRSANDLMGHVRAGAELVVSALAKQSHQEVGVIPHARRMLPGLGDFEAVRITPGSEADGKTLGSLGLRGRTGATVVALLRGEERIVFPEADERLSAGDFVAITGSHDAIEAAIPIMSATGRAETAELPAFFMTPRPAP
jgi:CPA2 family monovalent cation:H+ antiporter-2